MTFKATKFNNKTIFKNELKIFKCYFVQANKNSFIIKYGNNYYRFQHPQSQTNSKFECNNFSKTIKLIYLYGS